MEYRVLHYLFTRVGLLLAGRGVGSTVAVLKHGIQFFGIAIALPGMLLGKRNSCRHTLKLLCLTIIAWLSCSSLVYAEVISISPPPDHTLTNPENAPARNMGVWDGGFEDGGRTLKQMLQFDVPSNKKA